MNPGTQKTSDRHEPTAFVQHAVERHQAPLLCYACRFFGGNVERARDVVQDTFLRLMAQPPAEVDGHVAEWLYTVCRNRALDVLRKEGRLRQFEEGQMERLSQPSPPPARGLEQAEAQAAVLGLIDRLPPNQQEVIRLKFQGGFSYKEISRITSLSVGNVGFLLHTAINRLRREMAALPE